MSKTNPLSIGFALTLEDLREAVGMTTADLAAPQRHRSGYLERLEGGRHLPGLAVLWRISHALGVPPTPIVCEATPALIRVNTSVGLLFCT